MDWINVKDKLPIKQPEGWATYNWVIVTAERIGTDEKWPFNIARYTDEGWEFWDSNLSYCPCFGDTSDAINADEITHWLPITKPNR